MENEAYCNHQNVEENATENEIQEMSRLLQNEERAEILCGMVQSILHDYNN